MSRDFSRSIQVLTWIWCEIIWPLFQLSVAVASKPDRSVSYRSVNVSTGSSHRAAPSFKLLQSIPAGVTIPQQRWNIS
jgi:hypothetical protein